MKLAHDLLDKQLVDARKRPCGKVDGIVITLGEGPPRVGWIEAGSETLARRLGTRPARVVGWLVRKIEPRAVGRYRIPWHRIKRIALEVETDIDADEEPISRSEKWVRSILLKIPGLR